MDHWPNWIPLGHTSTGVTQQAERNIFIWEKQSHLKLVFISSFAFGAKSVAYFFALIYFDFVGGLGTAISCHCAVIILLIFHFMVSVSFYFVLHPIGEPQYVGRGRIKQMVLQQFTV